MDRKCFYFFGNGKAEGTAEMKNLLGSKGANLAEMTNIGIPVPPGFTISTEICEFFYDHDYQYPEIFEQKLHENMKQLETITNKQFGGDSPLLVSVRSGAAMSMPGMMDTILNLGLNDHTIQALIKISQDERFAYDSYRRFIQMFSNVVKGISIELFDDIFDQEKKLAKVDKDSDIPAHHLKNIVQQYKILYKNQLNENFPQDVYEQLNLAIKAVILSWNSDRAKTYRDIYHIHHIKGTAVNICSMVFGNLNNNSGTGVCFTRNPANGNKELFGEFLVNAQGEDIVAGIRTPLPISEMQKAMPEVYTQLTQTIVILEQHYKNMQDIEFTIENGTLYLLQTRDGKRTGTAGVRIAVDMFNEHLVSQKEALMLINASQLTELFQKTFDPQYPIYSIAKGLNASFGCAVGKVVFDHHKVSEIGKQENVILVCDETSPEYVAGMYISKGIVTARGGLTSHAAVVARSMGKPCIVGCEELHIDSSQKFAFFGKEKINEGDIISIDANKGIIVKGDVPLIESNNQENLLTILKWAQPEKKLQIYANGDTAEEIQTALKFGAEGVGLIRTEHMFFHPHRILDVRKMILSSNDQERSKSIQKLLPYQKQDFLKIFSLLDDKSVVIRYIDPPLHEFLPHKLEDIQELAHLMEMPVEYIQQTIANVQEINPMLGHRGCRLGISYPEIYQMQTQAIGEALIELKKQNISPNIELMIPLVVDVKEFQYLKKIIDNQLQSLITKYQVTFEYKIGTMIEAPRACLIAEQLAQECDFFSFGTNDLTQLTFGISRDDEAKFMQNYKTNNIFQGDPFRFIDREGVGLLMQMTKNAVLKAEKKVKIGVCGEHGGEPRSIEFFHQINLDYVSCSPYRIPTAIVAAAQAAIQSIT